MSELLLNIWHGNNNFTMIWLYHRLLIIMKTCRDLSGKYKYLLLLILYMKISMVKGELHFKRSSVCQRVHFYSCYYVRLNTAFAHVFFFWHLIIKIICTAKHSHCSKSEYIHDRVQIICKKGVQTYLKCIVHEFEYSDL